MSFGLSWSLVGSALALTYLASCSYLVPENPRPPRYNTVLGEKKSPMKNPSPANNFTMPDAQNRQPAAQPQPYAPQPQSQMTPTAPRPAEQSFVENTHAATMHQDAPAPVAHTQEEYSWWNPQGWFGDAKPAAPRNTPVRQTPAMNATPHNDQITAYDTPAPLMQPLPSSDAYPSLENTPLSPLSTGQSQARDRLNYARTDMEAELNAANMRANQLQHDARAEPSLLSSMPQYQEPAPSIVRPAPVMAESLPEPKIVEPSSRASAYSNEISVAEPIQLQPPQGKGAPLDTDVGVNTSMSTMDTSTSTFDPMAGSTQPIQLTPPEGTYSGKRYLPESRYVARRNY